MSILNWTGRSRGRNSTKPSNSWSVTASGVSTMIGGGFGSSDRVPRSTHSVSQRSGDAKINDQTASPSASHVSLRGTGRPEVSQGGSKCVYRFLKDRGLITSPAVKSGRAAHGKRPRVYRHPRKAWVNDNSD